MRGPRFLIVGGLLLLMLAGNASAQQTITVRGVVVDRETFCDYVRGLSATQRVVQGLANGVTRYERKQIKQACNLEQREESSGRAPSSTDR